MNCEQLRESLYDYLDDTLSPRERAALQGHMRECRACRQAVQREQLLAQALSEQMTQAVETVALNPAAQRRMARAVEEQSALTPALSPRRGKTIVRAGLETLFGDCFRRGQTYKSTTFRRLAVPATAAGLIVLSGFYIGRRLSERPSPHLNTPVSLSETTPAVSVDVSCVVPNYTFRREGPMVIDALTYTTCVMDGALLARK